jgi:hypothetical protein
MARHEHRRSPQNPGLRPNGPARLRQDFRGAARVVREATASCPGVRDQCPK